MSAYIYPSTWTPYNYGTSYWPKTMVHCIRLLFLFPHFYSLAMQFLAKPTQFQFLMVFPFLDKTTIKPKRFFIFCLPRDNLNFESSLPQLGRIYSFLLSKMSKYLLQCCSWLSIATSSSQRKCSCQTKSRAITNAKELLNFWLVIQATIPHCCQRCCDQFYLSARDKLLTKKRRQTMSIALIPNLSHMHILTCPTYTSGN
jgi:hypothetical protein